MKRADLERLVSIDEIGEKIAQSILTYFANEANCELVNRLKEAGLQFYRTEEDLSGYTDKLAGQSIVISGVFIHHSRDEYKELIEKNGGKMWEVFPQKQVLFLLEIIWDLQSWKKRKN